MVLKVTLPTEEGVYKIKAALREAIEGNLSDENGVPVSADFVDGILSIEKTPTPTPTPVLEAVRMKLNKATLTMNPGDTFKLVARIFPKEASDTTVTWKSGATDVVKVSKTGKLTAVAAGTAAVRAATANGLKAYCKITVKPAGVTKVTLNKTSASTNVGLTVQLGVTLAPSDAEDKTVTWKSSDTKVAKVSQKGLVTVVRCGTAAITATAATGVKAICKITVKEKYVYECVKGSVYRYTANTHEVKKTEGSRLELRESFPLCR